MGQHGAGVCGGGWGVPGRPVGFGYPSSTAATSQRSCTVQAEYVVGMGESRMNSQLRLGRGADGSDVSIDSSLLLDHSLVIGSKGTGKTSLGRMLLESANAVGCPVLVVDTTGDMTSYLQADLDVPLVSGLGDQPSGAGPVRLHSIGISFVESLFLRSENERISSESLADELSDLVAALLGLAGFRAKKMSPEFALIETIVWDSWSRGPGLNLAELIARIDVPPIERIGVFTVDQVISPERRADLAGALAGPLRTVPPGSPEARPIEIGPILTDDGAALATVLSFASGSERVQKFLVAVLLAKLKTYVSATTGDGGLAVLLYLDEASNLLPAGRRVITTAPLLEALRGWRRFGIGLVLVAEESDDLHEEAEDLCETWIVGNIPSPQSRQAVVHNLDLVNPPIDEVELENSIKTLEPGQFILRSSRLEHLEHFQLDWKRRND